MLCESKSFWLKCVGCYKANSLTELLPRLHEAATYDRHVVVEKATNATELECAVIGNDDISASL